MRKVVARACLLLATVTLAAFSANAQALVYAVTGTVTNINPQTNTIHVDTDDGSLGLFNVLIKTKTPLEFDKNIKAATTPASIFTKTNTEALVFYIGDEQVRTVVALQDLGPGPFVKTLGALVRLDKHAITIKNAAGAEETFQIDAKTIGDASEGVAEGKKFDIDKGAQVRIIATTTNGVQTALFIRALTL
jgi:hypothetical protein